MAREYDGRVTFIGMAGMDTIARMRDFVDTHDLHHFPHAATEDGQLWARFEINYQPAWVLIDANGEVVHRSVRPSMDTVRAELDAIAAP